MLTWCLNFISPGLLSVPKNTFQCEFTWKHKGWQSTSVPWNSCNSKSSHRSVYWFGWCVATNFWSMFFLWQYFLYMVKSTDTFFLQLPKSDLSLAAPGTQDSFGFMVVWDRIFYRYGVTLSFKTFKCVENPGTLNWLVGYRTDWFWLASCQPQPANPYRIDRGIFRSNVPLQCKGFMKLPENTVGQSVKHRLGQQTSCRCPMNLTNGFTTECLLDSLRETYILFL